MLEVSNDSGNVNCRHVVHYGITPFFVSTYMKFSANSLVFVDACYSNDPDLKTAFTNAGAGIYVGWSGTVSDGPAFKSAKCLFDRLLGVNMAAPKEDPPQRAFGTDVVMQDLQAHHLATDPTHPGTSLIITPLNAGSVVLAPSIKFMTVGDDDQISHLLIAGSFGTDPGEADRRVTVNGREVTVMSWSPTSIECQTPSSGLGSDGPVVVESRADVGPLSPLAFRQSNSVNITSWHGQFLYDRAEAGTLHESMTINLVIRADIHAFRDVPHEVPWATTVLFGDSRESFASAEATGIASGTFPGAEWSVAWTGTHDIGSPFSNTEHWGVGTSSIDTRTNMIDLNLFVLTTELTATTTEILDGAGTYVVDASLTDMPDSCLYDVWNGLANPSLPMGTFKIPFDSSYNIAAGINSCSPDPYVTPYWTGVAKATAKFEWQQMTPNFPPDPTAAR